MSINTDVTKKPTALSQQAVGPVYDLGWTVTVHGERRKERRDDMDTHDPQLLFGNLSDEMEGQ